MKRAGAFAVRDPRVTEEDNNKFLDLLEAYFEQPEGITNDWPQPRVYYLKKHTFIQPRDLVQTLLSFSVYNYQRISMQYLIHARC